MHAPVVIPDLRSIVRHAVPNVVEGKLVPLLLIVGLLKLSGMTEALLAALAWSVLTIAFRVATRRRVSGLIVLSAITLTARTVAAIVTGSMIVYFVQPTATTVLVGLAFFASVPLGTPLAQRLAFDVLPFDEATERHPLVREFFVKTSLVWAMTSLANAAVTIWLLLNVSTTTFIVLKSILGPTTGALTIGTMLLWLRFAATRTGTRVVWDRGTSARLPV